MTQTGGRSATVRHIAGESALSVGMPESAAPTGWRWVALTDIARLESGHTPSRRHPEYWGGDVPWLSIRDAKAHHGGAILDTIETTNSLGIENSSARVLPAGTVCLSRTASVGYVTILGRAMATSQDFVNWVCSEKLEPRFLQYLLIFEKPSLARFSSGAVHQTIYFPEVKAFHVCIPGGEEQRRIVAVLDEAFAAIATATANAEKNSANASELLERSSSSLLTSGDWHQSLLGDMCNVSSKLVDPRLTEYIDLPHVGAGNMESGTGAIREIHTAREEGLISGKFIFDSSMVLYSKIRPYLMKVARPSFAGLCSADVYPLTPKQGRLDRDFLFHVLLSRHFTEYAESGSARAGMPKVNREHLFAYPIKLPSITAQREIAMQIDEIADCCRHLARGYDAKLGELAALKASFLERAFAGELVVSPVVLAVRTSSQFATPQFTAQVIAFAHHRHERQQSQKTFGHVKAQKALQLIESAGGIDLGRRPIKDAAGPNDFQHMLRATDWAAKNGFFEFVPRASGNGYDFKKLANFGPMMTDALAATRPVSSELERAIDPIVPMVSQDAEVFATVHAAWNNLLHDGKVASDDAIVKEARDDWHSAKLKIPEAKFRAAIKSIRAKGLVPDGSAKYVGGQGGLF